MRTKTIIVTTASIASLVALIALVVSYTRLSAPHPANSPATKPSAGPAGSPSAANYERAKYELYEIEYKAGLDFPPDLEDELIRGYIYRAESSPYYWQALSEIVADAKLKSSDAFSREEINRRLQRFVFASWGTVKLGSNPKGAEVFVVKDGKLLPQGNTEIKYKYMEGSYSFKLRMNGYEDAWRNITVRADTPTEEIVELKKSQ